MTSINFKFLFDFSVAVLEARKLKKMDITGASDPYVKIKLFDSKVRKRL